MQYTDTVTYQREQVVRVTCDLCGAEHQGSDWSSGYDVRTGTLRYEDGKSYPDDQWITTTRADLCPACWTTRLLPWLLAQGGQYSVTELEGARPVVVSRAVLEAEFQRWAEQWREDTAMRSSLDYAHEAYRNIVRMGWPVVPVLLTALQRDRQWWFAALAEITGTVPHDGSIAGAMDAMAEAWLAWGRDRGLV
jgi:hypothetical protein